MTLRGDFSLVYSFGSQRADGDQPYAGLIQAGDGSFYGITQIGGANGYGSVFRLASDGSLSTIYSFCPESGCADGKYPTTRVIQGTDGNLYGTTYNGGSAGYGTVYRLTTGEAFLEVSIDIKPGDRSNTINLKSNGVVPVAILGSATFDPMTVDPPTVTFAGAHVAIRGRGVPMTGQADVNGDGYPDLILYFRTQDLTDLQLAVAAMSSSPQTGGGQRPPLQQVEAVLYGTTYSGQRIRGSGMVRIVPAVQTSASTFPRGRGTATNNPAPTGVPHGQGRPAGTH